MLPRNHSYCFLSLPELQDSNHVSKVINVCLSITFGDGSGASGIVYTDTVTVGGSTVTGQVVEFANSVSGFNQAGDAEDGILGLAFDAINTGTCSCF